ncbi:hypothetical protein DOTSEDRAFT_69536 [Dothistroma septosporum NZE10]|uniref:N-acetyltransferase domain-containing protein n=1 Tax=Dothistroma septosporum (strain NZE10 / CBS 128990) TaxID=675120 RepID=N1PW76_DOTSN|nr:hypothetical protein DOTSEDRAFT_69536 [Dothistroma septosporum NZE10]
MYRFTVSLSVFVHIDHHGKSIGSCLMDKILGLLDPEYLERGGYEIEGEELEAVGSPARSIKSIIISLPHEETTQGANRLEWMTQWLATLGFKEHGFLPDIGSKLRHVINLAIFYRQTSAVLDHAKPPAVVLPVCSARSARY